MNNVNNNTGKARTGKALTDKGSNGKAPTKPKKTTKRTKASLADQIKEMSKNTTEQQTKKPTGKKTEDLKRAHYDWSPVMKNFKEETSLGAQIEAFENKTTLADQLDQLENGRTDDLDTAGTDWASKINKGSKPNNPLYKGGNYKDKLSKKKL